MDVNSETSVARSESLLKWVNTFDGIDCTSFSDLSNGVQLLKCLQAFMPDVVFSTPEDPWKELFDILEEFCGCSLQRAISKELILGGDSEHISRVVVLLLCVAVQSKENERIVGDIMSMDVGTQRDIMFYIESTMAKIKSHAIVAGTFVSGVGEQLPSLEDKSAPSSPKDSSKIIELKLSPVQTLAREPSDEIYPFPTPRRPPRTLQPSNFYNGLDSLAGSRLLMSPAISKSKVSRIHQSDVGNSVRGALKFESQETEELSVLRHKVRVLKGSLEEENKLARDYYNELCARIEDHEQLKKSYYKLESKLESQQQLSDLQDELAHSNMDLIATQKLLANYKEQAESVKSFKERILDLEGKVKDYDQTVKQLDELKTYSQNVEKSLMEKIAEMKRLELALNKVTIELETKSSHVVELLQENRECKSNLHEREKQYTSLEKAIRQLEEKLENKEGTEIAMSEEKKEMSLEIDTLQESVRSSQAEVSSLMAEKHVTKVHIASLQEEISQLRAELNAKITELASKDFRIQSMESNIKVLNSQFTNLEVRAKELEKDLLQKEEEITASKSSLSSIMTHKSQLEVDLKHLQEQVDISEKCMSKLKETLTEKENKLVSLTDTCSLQEAEISKLTQQCSQQMLSLQNTSDSMESLRSEKSELQLMLQSVRQDMTAAEESFAAEKKKIADSFKELQASTELFQRKVSEQQRELAEKQKKILTLTEERDSLAESLKSEYSSKETELKSIAAASQKELNDLETEMKAVKKKLAKKASELDLCTQSISVTVSEKVQLEKEVEELKGNAEILNSDSMTMKEMLEKQTKSLQEKEQVIRQLHSELETQRKQRAFEKEESDKELAASQSLQASKEDKLREITLLNEKMAIEVCESKEKLQQVEKKGQESISFLQDQLRKKCGALAGLEQEKASLSQQIQTLQSKHDSECENLSRECSSLEIAVTERNKTISTLHDECIALKEEIRQQRESNAELGEKLDKILKNNESYLNKLNEECSRVNIMQADNCAKDEIIQNLQETNDSLKLETVELKNAIELVHSEKISAKDALDGVKRERDSLNERLVELQAELNAAQLECTALASSHKAELRALQEEMSSLKEENLALRERYKLAQQELEAQESESDKHKNTIGQMEQELKLSHSHLDKQSLFIDSLTRENNKYMNENFKLQSELSRLEVHLKKVSSTSTEKEKEVNSSTSEPHGLGEDYLPPVCSEEMEGKRRSLPQSRRLEVRVPAIDTQLLADSLKLTRESTGRSTVTAGTWTSDSIQSGTESATYKRLLRSSANLKAEVTSSNDEASRVRELRQRNKRALPHLKSIYPVEMLVQPEKLLSSDDSLKSQKSKIRRTTGRSTSEEQVGGTCSTRSGRYSKVKEDSEETWSPHETVSVSSSSPCISSPLTSEVSVECGHKQLTAQRKSTQKSLQLRTFLDQHPEQPQSSRGTSFNIVFSPPKGKVSAIPKRLRERSQRGVKNGKSGNDTSPSAAKKESPGTSRTSRNHRSTKQKTKI